MHYLDNAATSFPKPPGVADAVARAVASGAGNPGRGSSGAAGAALGRLETARHVVAEFVGAPDARQVAFTLNATDSLNLALRSLVRPGRPAVISALEHAAIVVPLRRLQAELGGDLRIVRPSASGLIDPDDVRRAARGASVVAMTCASNVLGVAQPWRDVAAALEGEGTPLLLDAAQAAGSLPLRIDELGPRVAVALTGHKALGGPMGVGALVVGSALELGPWREGGTGHSESAGAATMPTRLEAGTPPLPAIVGLAAAVEWWNEVGPVEVRAHEARLLRQLLDGLVAIPDVVLPGINGVDDLDLPRAPLVCFRVEGWGVDELGTLLESTFDISVRTGLHCAPDAHRFLGTHPEGLVRASIGPMTSPDSVEALLDALRRVTASG